MDKDFLLQAIELSKESIAHGGFPVGALVVLDGEVISTGVSNGKALQDATSHAEICAIREASQKLKRRDLKQSIVYSSLEPCLMCFAACYWASVTKVVYACAKTQVSKWHYEGLHDLNELNIKNNRQIEIVHLSDLQDDALQIITDWEKALAETKKF